MDLPMSAHDARLFSDWIRKNFGTQISTELADTPFNVNHACAIACQETGIYAYPWTKKMSPDDVLARCVFDASGDSPGDPRGPFPQNTAAFLKQYGRDFTDMLVAEANASRILRGYKPNVWVYKGYGLFQYDLQHIEADEAFLDIESGIESIPA